MAYTDSKTSDVQHNITDDNVINNAADVASDYNFANYNKESRDHKRHDDAGQVLFRLLIPGPANLRGRAEAYKVTR